MLNKVEYWLDSCDDDIKVAKSMLEKKHYLWAGFLCHLVAEKALKAVIENNTNETPPKIHDLKKLATKGKIYDNLSEEQKTFLDRLMPYQIEARYPEYKDRIAKTLNDVHCKQLLIETEEFLCFVKTKLGK
ncbi:MAG: HEPN domain-containing protein [Oscillospiraceae bacterium]|nr:HEPN domain-containing protein [Oscillospiraceae bacterium]